MTRWNPLTAAVALGIASAALAGCAPQPVDTDTSESTAVVDAFLAHLEAGEAREAAALTTIEFDDALVDDAFYRASAALPTDAHIVSSAGSADGAAVTVEFAFDGVDAPVTLELGTSRDGEEVKIDRLGPAERIGAPAPVPGTLIVNDRVEFPLLEPAAEVSLLPGAYAVEYADPTGLLEGADGASAFTAYVPEVVAADGSIIGTGFAFTPVFMQDVEPGLADALARLQAACEADGFAGPSCPAGFPTEPRESSSTEWFPKTEPQIVFLDGEFATTAKYDVVFWNGDDSTTVEASYTGTVSRDASGSITFTPSAGSAGSAG